MSKNNDQDGVWRTIHGRKVFIKEGQSLEDAMKKSGKFDNKQKTDVKKQSKKQDEDEFEKREARMMELAKKMDDMTDNGQEDDPEFEKMAEEYDRLLEQSQQEELALLDEGEQVDNKQNDFIKQNALSADDDLDSIEQKIDNLAQRMDQLTDEGKEDTDEWMELEEVHDALMDRRDELENDLMFGDEEENKETSNFNEQNTLSDEKIKISAEIDSINQQAEDIIDRMNQLISEGKKDTDEYKELDKTYDDLYNKREELNHKYVFGDEESSSENGIDDSLSSEGGEPQDYRFDFGFKNGAALRSDAFEDAKAYLEEEDMAQYLDDDLKEKIDSIKYSLDDESSVHVDIKANQPLNDDDMNKLKEFIEGQNSDGLGEGFEQQDFAEGYYDPDNGDGPYTRQEVMDIVQENYDNMDVDDYRDYLEYDDVRAGLESYLADGYYNQGLEEYLRDEGYVDDDQYDELKNMSPSEIADEYEEGYESWLESEEGDFLDSGYAEEYIDDYAISNAKDQAAQHDPRYNENLWDGGMTSMEWDIQPGKNVTPEKPTNKNELTGNEKEEVMSRDQYEEMWKDRNDRDLYAATSYEDYINGLNDAGVLSDEQRDQYLKNQSNKDKLQGEGNYLNKRNQEAQFEKDTGKYTGERETNQNGEYKYQDEFESYKKDPFYSKLNDEQRAIIDNAYAQAREQYDSKINDDDFEKVSNMNDAIREAVNTVKKEQAVENVKQGLPNLDDKTAREYVAKLEGLTDQQKNNNQTKQYSREEDLDVYFQIPVKERVKAAADQRPWQDLVREYREKNNSLDYENKRQNNDKNKEKEFGEKIKASIQNAGLGKATQELKDRKITTQQLNDYKKEYEQISKEMDKANEIIREEVARQITGRPYNEDKLKQAREKLNELRPRTNELGNIIQLHTIDDSNSNTSMNNKIRNAAYEKYMKAHPGSKMTLDEFLKKK